MVDWRSNRKRMSENSISIQETIIVSENYPWCIKTNSDSDLKSDATVLIRIPKKRRYFLRFLQRQNFVMIGLGVL